jgi:hypothetical protein
VTGRALVFSHDEVVRILKSSFVPYAGDQWYLHRQEDAAGKFFWKVVDQSHRRHAPRDESRQGVYAATGDGQILASDHYRPSGEAMVALLRSALSKWEGLPKTRQATVEAAPQDTAFVREPPAGGLILNVYTRIPLPPPAEKAWTPNQATGRDHMWVTAEESRSLLPARWEKGQTYPVPKAVAERLIRFHLVDNVRGEPNMWEPHEITVQSLILTVDDPASGRLGLSGTARMTAAGGRGYDARLQGVLVVDQKQNAFTKADILAWGEAYGEGNYTGGAPKGKFPLVIAFSLAGNSPADHVPPQGSRWLPGYLGTGR